MENRKKIKIDSFQYDIDKEKMLRNIILRIHHNEDMNKIKKDFNEHFADTSIDKILELEEKIIKEGIKKSVIDDMKRINQTLLEEKK